MSLFTPLAGPAAWLAALCGVRSSGQPPASRQTRLIALAWVAALTAICVRVGFHPDKQSVYATDYARAGWHWWHGAQIYSRARHFIYSPLVAAFFAPFSMLSDPAGGIVWRLFCAGLMLGTSVAWTLSPLSDLGSRRASTDPAPLLPATLLLLLPLAIGNLNLGQMNVVVLALAASGVLAVRRESWTLAAALCAAAAFIKIYPLALGLLLALLYPRQLVWRLALALAGLFTVSLGLQHPAYVWAEYRRWFELLRSDDRLDTDLYSTWRDFGFLLRAVGVPLSDHAYRIMEVLSGGALALFFWLGQRWCHWSRDMLLGGVLSLGCTWMMLFGPATEAATYVVLALPVCVSLAAAWTLPPVPGVPARRGWLAVVYGLLFVADVTNGWFHGLTHHLFMRALQPVAALIFTGGIVWRLLAPARATPNPLRHTHIHNDPRAV